MKKSLVLMAVSSVLMFGCEQSSNQPQEQNTTPAAESVSQQLTESEKAVALFDAIFKENVDRSPMMQGYMGIKKDYDKWEDMSEENSEKELQISKDNLERLKQIDTSKLDKQTLLSYQLLEKNLQQDIDYFKWRHHNYPINQMRGVHSNIPTFLINQHRITSIEDAKAYITRIKGSKKLLEQLIEQLN
ncbi:MAG: DUF885 family protein, partial [Gammaproteobacteria bacterium]|nr:DUF885 family protein [Gammaproteobacteria bacterium]